MKEYIEIQGNSYEYVSKYKDNEVLRTSFNNLAKRTFNIDFEQWYKAGYWGDGYIPYSLVVDKKVVANVSVSIMEFLILGKRKKYIQIGTVMTEESYRGKGLCKTLMEMVLKEWEEKCDLIYLFANDSVTDFYPKFGFAESDEYECSINVNKKTKSSNIIKMDMSSKKHGEILKEIVSNTKSFSKVTTLDNASLVMFYCTSFMEESVYYLEEYKTIVIAEFENDKLYLQDVFSTRDIKLDTIIEEIITNEIKEVVLGFTPNENIGYKEDIFKEEDTTLFVRGNNSDIFKLNKLRFPVLSHT
ncbi:MAG: GNAT family N-acetyltransferase [Clostridium sp.]